jgi:hypothetical protein
MFPVIRDTVEEGYGGAGKGVAWWLWKWLCVGVLRII